MASLCIGQHERVNISSTVYLGTQSFLSVWQPPGAQTGSLKNLHPYGKSLAYFIYSVYLLKMFLSLD